MHQTFELVAIHDPADLARRLLIRKGDFDPSTHREWGTAALTEAQPEPKPTAKPAAKAAREVGEK